MSHMTLNYKLSLTAFLALSITGSTYAQDGIPWFNQVGTAYTDYIDYSTTTTTRPLEIGDVPDPDLYNGVLIGFAGSSTGILPNLNFDVTIDPEFDQMRTSTDGIVIAYKTTGEVLWNKRLAEFGTDTSFGDDRERDSSSQYITGITADSNGGMIVTGYTQGMMIDDDKNIGDDGKRTNDMFMVRYDYSGNVTSTLQTLTQTDDRTTSIMTDADNNIFVAGMTRGFLGDQPTDSELPANINQGGRDAFVIKYESDGETILWQKQFGTAGNDQITDMKADDLGNIYVTGTTYGYIGNVENGVNKGSFDTFIRKFSADGEELWTKQYGSSQFDETVGIELHTDGDGEINIYVTGTTYNLEEWDTTPRVQWDEGEGDIFVQKLNDDGNMIWNTILSTDDDDQATDIHIDADGKIYITGYTLGTYLGIHYGNEDAIVMTIDEDGNFLEGVQFAGSEDQRFNTLTTDEDGNVYIGGDTNQAMFDEHQGGSDFIAMKLYDLPVLLGDTNYDGVVDEVDLQNIIENFGEFGYDADGVLGRIDLNDLLAVRNNWGGVRPTLASIPEPASLLTLAGLGGLALHRRNRG